MKSIAAKFNLLSIFLIVLTALVTGGYIIWHHQLDTFNNFTRHGEETAVMLAKNIEYGVYTENLQAIEQALQGFEQSPDTAYVVVFNKQQQILAQHNYRQLSGLPPLATGGDKKISKRVHNDPKHPYAFIDIVAPVYMQTQTASTDFESFGAVNNEPELIGTIQLGISQERIYQSSRQFMLPILSVVSLTLLLGILLTLYQTRRITRPIKKLLLATQTLSKGNFGTELVPSSNDEIGALTLAFNAMSQDLAGYQAETVKQRETLEEQVMQRTLDLQHKTDEAYQLAHKAEAASKAKSEFIATMSHEIRTPMNGVLGMTELLMNTELTARQKRLAETAYHSAGMLLEIINNILDFSKLESGKFQLCVDNFDLRHLLEDITEMLATQAHNKGLELVLNLPVNLHGMVRGDSERLRQVLVNLLGNAIKFTQQGEVQLKLSWQQRHKADQPKRLLFEVIDTGPGIAAEQQQSIFESFTQADGSITRRYGGTGLGLTISKQLVELMGSELELDSRLGDGSRFYFSLNLECSRQSPIKKIDLSGLQGLNILVVDDNATNREILENQLKAWGVSCHCEPGGNEAIEHLLATAPDNKRYQAMLLDWHMPDMDGLTLAAAINGDQRIPPLPLVMLSSDTVTFDEHQNRHGIRYFLNKPVLQLKLLDCLLELFGAPADTAQQPVVTVNAGSGIIANILLVEDNLINQEVGLGMLNEIGCKVDVANNGLEAVEAAANKHYDLILMDYHMPEMDGMQASLIIRQREQQAAAGQRIPIIALTADVQKGTIDQCLDAGMDDYLSKPFSKKQLQKTLDKWLELNVGETVAANAIPAEITPPPQSLSLNPDVIENLRRLNTAAGESLLNRVITLFLRSAPEDIRALRTALDNQDCSALHKIAHSFKSASGNLGAQILQENAAAIEAIAKQSHIDGVQTILGAMENDLPEVLEALRQQLDIPAAGLEYILTKPIQASQLYDSIMTVTGGYQPEACAVEPEGFSNEIELENIHGAHVLLVEDNELNQEVSTALLNHVGLIVDLAVDGAVAVKMVQETDYDAVLMDMQMPVMDGLTATREIRKDARFKTLPIIAMTANAMSTDCELCIEAGMNDYVTKPIDPKVLGVALVKWIKPRNAAAAPAKPLIESSRTQIDGIDGIDGLNIGLGLKRVLGKQALYLSMLRKFVAGQKNAPAQISEALNTDDRNTAERLAHTLKSVAGNIGAGQLQAEAGQLETAIKAKHARESIDERVVLVSGLLSALIAQLEEKLPAQQTAAAAVDLQRLQEVCAELARLLDDDNAEAGDRLDEHAGLLEAAFGESYHPIDSSIRNYDFELALAQLKKTAAKLDIEL